MIEFTVEVTAAAERDIFNTIGYISKNLDAPQAASDHMDAIDDALDNLAISPFNHPFVRDEKLARIGFRWVSVKNYTLFYIVNQADAKVKVMRFLYTKCDWQQLLGGEIQA